MNNLFEDVEKEEEEENVIHLHHGNGAVGGAWGWVCDRGSLPSGESCWCPLTLTLKTFFFRNLILFSNIDLYNMVYFCLKLAQCNASLVSTGDTDGLVL